MARNTKPASKLYQLAKHGSRSVTRTLVNVGLATVLVAFCGTFFEQNKQNKSKLFSLKHKIPKSSSDIISAIARGKSTAASLEKILKVNIALKLLVRGVNIPTFAE